MRIEKVAKARAGLLVELKFSAGVVVADIRNAEADRPANVRNDRGAGPEMVSEAAVEREKIGVVGAFLQSGDDLADSFDISAEPVVWLHHIRQNQPKLKLGEPEIMDVV